MELKAPFPWFGGKSRVASIVWERFGADVKNYVEPFFGSGAVLLGRPGGPGHIETVNDKDGYISNFWRAIAKDPEAVAHWADWPVNENDLHARHAWLVERKAEFVSRLEGDHEFYDAKVAGFWVWGICSYIGGGWCGGRGSWHQIDGEFVKAGPGGVCKGLPHLGKPRGVNRSRAKNLAEWFAQLSERLRRVRVACGDWSRVVGLTPTTIIGTTAVFLDPPYADTAGRASTLYSEDSLSVAHEVREWAIANGSSTKLRIALCGYEGEHKMPDDWECVAWKAAGGYGTGRGTNNTNKTRERIWFSPHCLKPSKPNTGDLWQTNEG